MRFTTFFNMQKICQFLLVLNVTTGNWKIRVCDICEGSTARGWYTLVQLERFSLSIIYELLLWLSASILIMTKKSVAISTLFFHAFRFFAALLPSHSGWKLLKMSHLKFLILAFSTNFCSIKSDLSGNTVWPQALGFQKLAKIDHFWHF